MGNRCGRGFRSRLLATAAVRASAGPPASARAAPNIFLPEKGGRGPGAGPGQRRCAEGGSARLGELIGDLFREDILTSGAEATLAIEVLANRFPEVAKAIEEQKSKDYLAMIAGTVDGRIVATAPAASVLPAGAGPSKGSGPPAAVSALKGSLPFDNIPNCLRPEFFRDRIGELFSKGVLLAGVSDAELAVELLSGEFPDIEEAAGRPAAREYLIELARVSDRRLLGPAAPSGSSSSSYKPPIITPAVTESPPKKLPRVARRDLDSPGSVDFEEEPEDLNCRNRYVTDFAFCLLQRGRGPSDVLRAPAAPTGDLMSPNNTPRA